MVIRRTSSHTSRREDIPMQVPWEALAHIENFLQLNFLFSGLEVSSTAIFLARIVTSLVFGAGLMWVLFRIIMKILDCLQTFLGSIGTLPKSFFLLLLLVVPLSSDSIGAKWVGYLLLVLSLLGLGALGVLVLVLWKYGVDQALRLINNLRAKSTEAHASTRGSSDNSDHAQTKEPTPPLMDTRSGESSWIPTT
jgi:hypothetical protein